MSTISFNQNHIVKESSLNLAASTGLSSIASRFQHIITKEGMIVGSLSATSILLGNFILGNERNTFLRDVANSLASLAILFFATLQFIGPMNQFFGIACTPNTVFRLIYFSFLVDTGSSVLKHAFKDPLKSIYDFDALSDKQIQSIYKKFEYTPNVFKNLPPIMQLLVYRRFLENNLEPNDYPDPIDVNTIQQLHSDKIKILYKRGCMPLEERNIAHALMKRYFDLKLDFQYRFKRFLNGFSLPKLTTVTDVKELSPAQINWYKALAEHDPSSVKEHSINARWELFEASSGEINEGLDIEEKDDLILGPPELIWSYFHYFDDHGIDEWIKIPLEHQKIFKKRFKLQGLQFIWPCHPQTAQEVNDFNKETLLAYHKTLTTNFGTPHDLTSEAILALLYCFHLSNLNLDAINPTTFSKVEIRFPKTPEDVKLLNKYELHYLDHLCRKTTKMWDSFSFDMQKALNERFLSTTKSCHPFTVKGLTVEGINTASTKMIEALNKQFQNLENSKTEIPNEIQQALKERQKG